MNVTNSALDAEKFTKRSAAKNKLKDMLVTEELVERPSYSQILSSRTRDSEIR